MCYITIYNSVQEKSNNPDVRNHGPWKTRCWTDW